MEKLLDKSMAQTDRVVEIAKEAIELNDKLITERDRLREINKELVAALKDAIGWLNGYECGGAIKSCERAYIVLAKAEKTT